MVYLPPTHVVCRKVMFSDMFVSLLNSGGGGSHVTFPWCTGAAAVYKQLWQARPISWCLESKQVTSSVLWDSSHGTPQEVVVEEEPPPEVMVEEDPPQKWWWKRTPPPQGKDQTRPAEKYCWASGRYALEKRLSCSNYWFLIYCTCVFIFPFRWISSTFYRIQLCFKSIYN